MEELTRRDFMGAAAAAAAGVTGMAAVGGLGATTAEAAGYDWDTLPEEVGVGPLDPGVTDEEVDAMLLDQTIVTEDYTTPGGQTIPACYINLRNRLNRIGIGMGSDIEDNEHAWDFVMYLFSEEDCEHMMELPIYKVFNAQDYAAVSGRPIDECAAILEDLGARGLIYTRERAGAPYYELITMEPGIWEYNAQHFSDPDFINAHHQNLGSDMAYAFNESIPQVMALPVSPDVVDGDMLPYTSWEEAIRQHGTIATLPCACRSAAATLGESSEECQENHPTDTCLYMGELGQWAIESGLGHERTVEEAIELVRENIDRGFVPEVIWNKKQEVMCQCCGDTCAVLTGYRAYNDCAGSIMQYCSPYNLSYDTEACLQCYTCVDRCPMDAITIGDDGYLVNGRECVRCGQCAYVCPAHARMLTPKPEEERIEPAEDWTDKEHDRARRRMRAGLIHDFTGAQA